jgi:rhodanese-related sulfurtransferase
MRIAVADLPAHAILLDVRDDLDRSGQPLEAVAGGRAIIELALVAIEAGAMPAIGPKTALKPALVVAVCVSGAEAELAAAYLAAGGLAVEVLVGGYRGLKAAHFADTIPRL